jgi:nucleoside-diphosphate-sugar epimerase
MNRILVTGSESFIGKELILALKKKKIYVFGIDKIKKTKFTNLSIDINSNKISDIIVNKKINTIFHLAAISRDIDCKKNVQIAFKTNVMGTLNLIEIAKKTKIKNFIFASSEWVYDTFERNKVKQENDLINIKKISSEYALSKLVSENNLRQFYDTYSKINITILRFGIIYGNRDNNWSAVESLFVKVKNRELITVGSFKTARRFIHVQDICSGLIASLKVSGFNIINLQGKKMISLLDIVKHSSKILKKTYKIQQLDKNNPNIRKISNLKSKKILKWQPKISISSGLKMLNTFLKND